MRELVKSFLEWYLGALDAGGYPLITFLMALESSLVPLPSEVVIPPAAHVAYTRGTMSLTGIVVAGTVGSWLGATAMYWAARLLGRPLLMRYGRYVMITPEMIPGMASGATIENIVRRWPAPRSRLASIRDLSSRSSAA
mgnify:CR=1 FL=1